MLDRNIKFTSKKQGILNGYKLIINKRSYKNPEIGFANIIKDNDSIVEGILYDVDINEIFKLDKYEGFPKHYNRVHMNISGEDSIVYIANPKWVSDIELKTTKEYKNHILEGKKYLSSEYYNILEKIRI
jgi:gamma-glutamylcyclotransferase (GGCT)/AIG2-like uncharacterized protein YtfP